MLVRERTAHLSKAQAKLHWPIRNFPRESSDKDDDAARTGWCPGGGNLVRAPDDGVRARTRLAVRLQRAWRRRRDAAQVAPV